MNSEEQHHMPPCIGGYEPKDRTCNGDSKAESEGDQLPCSFRDRCVAVIQLVKLKKKSDPEYDIARLLDVRKRTSDKQKVAIPKSPKLGDALDKVVAKYGIMNGRLANASGKSRQPMPPIQQLKNRSGGEELVSWYHEKLRDASGRRIHPVPGDAEVGELFIVDRLEKSNYAACYAANAKGRGRVAVSSVQPNRRSGTLQVRIACDFHQFMRAMPKATLECLEPTDISGKDGAFNVRLLGLDKERVASAAEAVAKAMEHGIISLPEVG